MLVDRLDLWLVGIRVVVCRSVGRLLVGRLRLLVDRLDGWLVRIGVVVVNLGVAGLLVCSAIASRVALVAVPVVAAVTIGVLIRGAVRASHGLAVVHGGSGNFRLWFVHGLAVVHGWCGNFRFWFVHRFGAIIILFGRDCDGDSDVSVTLTVEALELPGAGIVSDEVRVTGFESGDVDAQFATNASVTMRVGVRVLLGCHLVHVLGLIFFQLPAVASGRVLADKDLDGLSFRHLNTMFFEFFHFVAVGEIVLPVVVDLSLDYWSDVRVLLFEIGHW